MKKKIFFVMSGLGIMIGAPVAADFYVQRKAEASALAMPYQIGLVGVTIVPCKLTPPPVMACEGSPLCLTRDQVRCKLSSEVIGTPAGGMGASAIFLKSAILKAGLVDGGQLIAGGMSMTEMDKGILASAGGCSGCSLASRTDKAMDWLADFSIASVAHFPLSWTLQR